MGTLWMLAICAMMVLPGNKGQQYVSLPEEKNIFYKFLYHDVLDPDAKYHLLWTPKENYIVFEVQVATQGYVGLGFSHNGGMTGADIIIGWVDDQGPHVHDRHATGFTQPIIDDSQDITVYGGYQNSTHTVFRFSRPWVSCDEEHDFPLSDDTIRVMWAYHDEDPENYVTMKKHSNRGVKSIFLKNPLTIDTTALKGNYKTWQIRAPQTVIPSDLDTLYWCHVIKMPHITRKHQIIGIVPRIEKKNVQLVHHIVVYECYLPDSKLYLEKWLGIKGKQCYSASIPESWNLCNTIIIGWAVGSEGIVYPNHVGLPMGEEYGGSTYFKIEMHYDNPKLKRGLVDSSGFDIYYTDELRPYDLGLLLIGTKVSPLQLIPPGQRWQTVGLCSPDCTQNLPAEGVMVTGAILHTHLSGRGIRVRQIRNGREMPTKLQDMNYDFNYQQYRALKYGNFMLIKPGDTLLTECYYDSRDRVLPTYGGFGTRDEMCLAFMMYYPKTNMRNCLSHPELSAVYRSFGIHEIYDEEKQRDALAGQFDKIIDAVKESRSAQNIKEGNDNTEVKRLAISDILKNLVVKEPNRIKNMTLYDILNHESTWRNEVFLRNLQNQLSFGLQETYCNSNMPHTKITQNHYPRFWAQREQRTTCTP